MYSVTYLIETKKPGLHGPQTMKITRRFKTDLGLAAFVNEIIERENFVRILNYGRPAN